jgi:pseudouridine synthase
MADASLSEPVRLHRRIAMAGICSRRAAEELIAEGRVRVNGETVTEQGTKVGADDVVEVDGETLGVVRSTTLIMNKPLGYITTLTDPKRRPTVMRLLPRNHNHVKPVGRLDMDTEGLLLFTSDGELAHRLAHPRYEIDKEYEAVVSGVPDEGSLGRLRRGIRLDDGPTGPAEVEILGNPITKGGHSTTKLRIIIHEGKNRQVRRMLEAIGHPVVSLKRTRLGFLTVKGLRSGECKNLGQAEVKRLRQIVGLES